MIFGVVNVKGGVGKSTLSVHLVTWLRGVGLETALIDADVQQSSSRWLQEIDSSVPIARVSDPNDVRPTVKRLLKEVPGIVIDGPAGLSELSFRILMSCDTVLVPCGPSLLDLEASQLTISAVREAQEAREGNRPHAIMVANRVQPHLRVSQDMLETAKELGIPLAKTVIKLKQSYPDARSQGTTVFAMGYKTKEASEDLQSLFREAVDYGENGN